MATTVKGLDQLLKRLAQLDAEMQSATLGRAALAAGLTVEAKAKRLVPVKTGNLRRSITTQLVEQTNSRAVSAVGTNVEYAAAVEFGYKGRSAKSYLRPAMDSGLDDARAAAEAVIAQALGAYR